MLNQMETNHIVFIDSEVMGQLIDEDPAQLEFSGKTWLVQPKEYNPMTGVMIVSCGELTLQIWREAFALFDDEYRVTMFMPAGPHPELDKPYTRPRWYMRIVRSEKVGSLVEGVALGMATLGAMAFAYWTLGGIIGNALNGLQTFRSR